MDLDPGDPSEHKRKEALAELSAAAAASTPAERQQRMERAWQILEDAVNMNPNNNRARFLLVSCLMNSDDFRRAKAEGLKIYNSLSKEQRMRMGDAVLHISLAHSSKMLGEFEDAVKFASEASEAYPHDPHPHMILGELYEAMEENHLAEKKCRETLMYQNEPDCKHPLSQQSVYFTLCCLGASLIKQEKLTEAERFLAQATEVSGSSTLAFRHLVDVYELQGRIQDALDVARHMVNLDPDDDEIRQKIMILEEQEDHFPRDTHSQTSDTELRMPYLGSDAERSTRGGRLVPGSERGGSVRSVPGSVRSHRSQRSHRSAESGRSHRSHRSGGYADEPPHSGNGTFSESHLSGRRRSEGHSHTTVEKRGNRKDDDDFFCCCFDRPSSNSKSRR